MSMLDKIQRLELELAMCTVELEHVKGERDRARDIAVRLELGDKPMTYEMTYLDMGLWIVECRLCEWAHQIDSLSQAHDTAIRHLRTVHA